MTAVSRAQNRIVGLEIKIAGLKKWLVEATKKNNRSRE